ncbi:MAG: helix-turn-helix domain-containing protein [Paramuribaculum sp.]|nr:helix-turn-helix domain-containing protein [Paramuribaculum sp.]
MVSDVVEAYEKKYYPIAKPTIGELISLSIAERGMTQKQLANELGISPSRVSDYISGRAEPTLRIARALCLVLGIAPASILGL